MAESTRHTKVVIDTNLLLDDSKILFKLSKEYQDLILPITVLQELDKHKFKQETSFSAREALRAIIEFKTTFPNRIVFDTKLEEGFNNDAHIINAAKRNNAVLATKDMSMSVIAEASNVEVKLYDVVLNNIFSPYVYIKQDVLYWHCTGGVFSYGRFINDDSHGREYSDTFALFERAGEKQLNEEAWFYVFIEGGGPNSVIYAHNPIEKAFVKIDDNPKYREIKGIKGKLIKARDMYQTCAIYALKEAQHVLITGKYGSGKTLLATANALVKEDKKIFVSRAPIGLNSKYNIGFVPGPQPLDAKLLTPTGWVTMGEIGVGDEVISANGKPTKILKTYDKGIKPVYTIKTSDGKKTRACGDHLWATKTHNEFKHNKDFKLRTTLEIKENLLNHNKGTKYNITLPSNKAVVFHEDNEIELPIPPYTMGILLAEGGFSNSINFTTEDEEIVDRVKKELKAYGLYLNKNGIHYTIFGNWKSNKYPKKIKITNLNNNSSQVFNSTLECSKSKNINKTTINSRCTRKSIINDEKYEFIDTDRHYANYIKHSLEELNLLNTKCNDKFIPSIYKYTNINNRVKLIQGLMDGGGTIKPITGEQTYFTTSIKLVSDLIEIVRSLGENPTFITRDRRNETGGVINNIVIKNKLISYCVNIPKSSEYEFFYLTRKKKFISKPLKKSSVKVVSVEKCEKNEQVKCIKIDNNSHLYLTDDFIVTHNTKEDKMQDWLAGFMSALYYLYGNTKGQGTDNRGYDYVKEVIFREKLEPIPMNSIQGMSLLDSDTLIIDEVQLIDVSYMSMILSRPSETGRLILLGDLKQTYNVVKPSESGLLKLLRVLPHKSLAYVELQNSYRSDILELADLLQDKTIG